jgi:DNA-binding winged helix-turn-helix (wHTH) protein
MEVVGSGIFEFERFRLDRRGGGLFCADKHGAFVPVAIGSRALDLLCVLVQRHGDLVSKEEIMAAVWPGIVVADSNLPIQILALRRVLDRGRGGGSCIQTVAGRGYRFVVPVMQAQCKYADTSEVVEAPTAGRDVLVERRPLTVLAGSIVSVPASAAEADPEELLDTMATLYRACADAFKRYDGFVTHLPGDTFFAYFGYPAAHEDDPERAVRAGISLVDIIGRFEAPGCLQTRIGIATGLVIIGDVIGEGHGRPNVVGTAPSLATTLHALAAPNTILIAESTQRQVGAFFALEDAGSQLPCNAPQRATASSGRAARPGPVRGAALYPHTAGRTGRGDGSARPILDPSKGR